MKIPVVHSVNRLQSVLNVLIAFALLATAPQLSAYEDAIAATLKTETVTKEAVESRQKEAEQSKDLDDAARSRVVDYYRRAGAALKKASDSAARCAESKRLAEIAPRIAEQTTSELKQLREREAAKAPDTIDARPLAVLEQEALESRASLEALVKEQTELEKEPARRATRRKDILANLSKLTDEGGDLRKQLASPAPGDEARLVTAARKMCLRAELQGLEQRASTLEAELTRYDAEETVDLVRLERDLLALRVALLQRRAKTLIDSLNHLRREAADRAVAEAHRREVDAPPLLRSYAEENTKLAEEARTLTKRIEKTEADLAAAGGSLKKLNDQFTQTKQKADGVGLTGPIGQLLRKQRDALPEPRDFHRSVDEASRLIDESQFRLYELDDLRSPLARPEPIVEAILAQASPSLHEVERSKLEKASQDVIETKRQTLDTLVRNYNRYYDTLLELVITQRALIGAVDKYADYIDERVLWIRSSRPLSTRELGTVLKPVRWLIKPANWTSIGAAFWNDARQNPLSPLGFLLLCGSFWYVRRQLRGEGTPARETQRATFTRFWPTLQSFGLTLLVSLFGSGMFWYLWWRLSIVAYNVEFPAAVSEALLTTGWLYWPLEMLRRSCKPHGLAESHLGWSPAALRSVGRNLRWLSGVGLPLTFVSEVLQGGDADAPRMALERILFAAGMVLVAVFLFRILRPLSGVMRELIPHERGDWIDRAQMVCRGLGVAGSLALALLVVSGYDYTARQIVWRLYLTGVVLVAVYYSRAIVLRWILIHRRRLAMQQVKDRVAEKLSAEVVEIAAEAGVHVESSPKIDLAALSEQTRTLLNVGLLSVAAIGFWRIWLDVFPSMNVLNQWELWTVGEEKVPVTVGKLLIATFVASLTWIATRNLPGLLEMTILPRLPLDAAGRFAFSTIARYAIVMLGLVLVANTIGIGWQKVQWLATALTFGLAFGLQEIFANFIAGLIILFERPVRVGDMVTIDNVTGVVSRIRIRATTIVNGDHKEFIVPNKEFITGRLLNWTLSDTINRIVINVEVASGSDPELVQKLLLDAAHKHPSVLPEPAPSAAFEEFGETGLKLVLNCFLPNLTERTRVTHELHTAINRALATHGIEIPFPPRRRRGKSGRPLRQSAKAGTAGHRDAIQTAQGPHGGPRRDVA